MRINGYWSLPVLVLFGIFTAVPTTQSAAAQTMQFAGKPPDTYPQIVRLSYVEGDVRVARGKEAEKQLENVPGEATGWEQAVANLPLQTGYSLVTGTGRAEIEFEDASVVYLGDNSVLEFYEISTTGGIPYTEIALLSGTASVNVQTLFPGEGFRLNTPTDHISINYPQKAYLRVNSYLDAIAVTPQKNAPWYAPLDDAVGKTLTMHNQQQVTTPEMDTVAMSDWDKWVAQRVSARDVELAAAMKDAGLTEPIPGLAEMNGQGKFFACEPYGTCWEPTEGWNGYAAEGSQVVAQRAAPNDTQPAAPIERVAPNDEQTQPAVAPKVSGAPKASAHASKSDVYLANHPGATMWTEDYTMPCEWYPITDVKAIDPVTGKEVIVDSFFDTSIPYPMQTGYPRLGRPYAMRSPYLFAGYGGMINSPWDWGVCHAGSWVRWHHRYAWVAGTKRHHEPPVRWVKRGRQVGFVPIHPKDAAGKTPINLKDGIIVPTKKANAITVKRTDFKEGKPIELLAQAPKQFRTTALEALKIAQVPLAVAHSAFSSSDATKDNTRVVVSGTAKSVTATGGAFAMKEQGTPITFDRKTQSFMMARPVMQNGRSSTVEVPLGGRIGSVQASGNGSSMMRTSVASGEQSYNGAQSSNGAQSRPATNTGSASNAGSSARTYTPAPSNSAPAQSNSAPARSYTPPSAPAYTQPQPARTYTPPPAPAYTPPPAPVYTPPPAPTYTPPPAPAYTPPPAPAYNPPSAPSNSGGSIRK